MAYVVNQFPADIHRAHANHQHDLISKSYAAAFIAIAVACVARLSLLARQAAGQIVFATFDSGQCRARLGRSLYYYLSTRYSSRRAAETK